MLHPVGPLPARVYWRRRLVLLAVLLAFGGGWLGVVLQSRVDARAGTEASAPTSSAPREPALARVVPSVAAVRTPSAPAVPDDVQAATTAVAPVAGGPCTDDMLALEVRTPGAAAVGSKPTFELVVTNAAAVPCTRALDKGLQELILLDAAGNRVWGSNDCFREATSDTRTLAPGEAVSFPVLWGGLTSEPTCTVARTSPPAGNYLVRGRLDTKSSPDAPLTLGQA